MKGFLLILAAGVLAGACQPKIERKPEFLEVRVTRQTALEGGETLLLRKIGDDWSALLLGDGYRFSCLYQKSVQPKSGWENFWRELVSNGLLEISDGRRMSSVIDGHNYTVEVLYQNRLRRYSFDVPETLKTKDAGQIRNIGNLIGREFETPVFLADYNREKVGDHLQEQCRNFSGQDSIRYEKDSGVVGPER